MADKTHKEKKEKEDYLKSLNKSKLRTVYVVHTEGAKCKDQTLIASSV